jgi:hypothetical protein
MSNVRPLFRLRWKPFVVRMPARLKSQRDTHYGRSTKRSVERPFGSFDGSACIATVRQQAPEAFRYLEEGHARGKVVMTSEQKEQT